jgi:hypothetical protein
LLRIGRAYEKVTGNDAWRSRRPKAVKNV